MEIGVLIAALVAIAAGVYASMKSNSLNDAEPQAGTKAALTAPKTFDVCAQSRMICTFEFSPATCSVTVGGKEIKQGGSNLCVAKSQIYAEICNQKISFTADDDSRVTCKKDEE